MIGGKPIACAGITAILCCTGISAQSPRLSADSLVRVWAYGSPWQRAIAAHELEAVFLTNGKGNQATRDSVGRRLVRLARMHPDPHRRVDAITLLKRTGRPTVARPAPEAFPLILEIFRTAQDPGMIAVAITAMGELAATNKTLPVLTDLARNGDPRLGLAKVKAIYALSFNGSPGAIAFLKRLHEGQEGPIDSEVKRYLDDLKNSGYREPSRRQ